MHSAYIKSHSKILGLGHTTYAILGDDVAIANDTLANSYTELMTLLGVEVNPIKGFQGKVLEFAKNLFHVSGVNLSPLGAKAILRSIRKPEFFVACLVDLCNKEFTSILIMEMQVITKFLEKLHNKVGFAQ
jgi:hypothetical protein